MRNTLYSCQTLIKFPFSRPIFEKSSIKVNENPSSWDRVAPYGHTDGLTNTTQQRNAFRQFYEYA